MYKAYRDAAERLQARAIAGWLLARREPSVALAAARSGAIAPLPPRLDPALLAGALDRLAVVVPPAVPPPESMPRTMTLDERAALIRAALAEAGPVVLQELLAGVRDRVVIAVTFLAMLELVKRREVTIEQDRAVGSHHRPTGPATRHGGTGAHGAGRTGATDRAPDDEEDA